MFSRKILVALGISASASAFAPAGPALRVGASKTPVAKGNAAARRPAAVRNFALLAPACAEAVARMHAASLRRPVRAHDMTS